MTSPLLNTIADYTASQITHIGLIDEFGVELSSMYYARQPVSWSPAVDGAIHLLSDVDFMVNIAASVKGWACYSSASGGTPVHVVPATLFQPTSVSIYRLQSIATGLTFAVAGG